MEQCFLVNTAATLALFVNGVKEVESTGLNEITWVRL